MKIRICHHTSIGLQNDALLLKTIIQETTHHTCQIVSYDESGLYSQTESSQHNVDVQFFLEHIHPSFINWATFNIFIPNIEFANRVDVQNIPRMDRIVAKTEHAKQTLTVCFPQSKILYWGWSSTDRYDPNVTKKINEFVHIKGVSRFKNSQTVVDLWLKHPEWPLLHLFCYGNESQNGYLNMHVPFVLLAPNIKWTQRKINEDELKDVMNRFGVHICCSVQEGFGHYINEAKACKAAVISTDGRPMNELIHHHENGLLVKTISEQTTSLGKKYHVCEVDMEAKIQMMINLDENTKRKFGERNRHSFTKMRNELKENVIETFKQMKL